MSIDENGIEPLQQSNNLDYETKISHSKKDCNLNCQNGGKCVQIYNDIFKCICSDVINLKKIVIFFFKD